MDIPVTGFVVHSGGEDDPHHAHRLYITSWDGRPVHVHPFSGTTSYDAGHRHHYAGMTEPAPSGVQHVHGYFAVTSFDDGHSHTIRGTTGVHPTALWRTLPLFRRVYDCERQYAPHA